MKKLFGPKRTWGQKRAYAKYRERRRASYNRYRLRRFFGIESKQEYGTPSITLRGERVRSKTEAIIADWFTRNGIAYQYEPPLMGGFLIKRIEYKSDFYLPQFNAYVEYWGLAYTERSYGDKMAKKASYYRSHGLRLISIYPNNLSNLGAYLMQELRLTGALRYCENCGQMLVPGTRFCTRCGRPAAVGTP